MVLHRPVELAALTVHVDTRIPVQEESVPSGSGKIRGMKRRTLLVAAPLAVLAPCEIAEAMRESKVARWEDQLWCMNCGFIT